MTDPGRNTPDRVPCCEWRLIAGEAGIIQHRQAYPPIPCHGDLLRDDPQDGGTLTQRLEFSLRIHFRVRLCRFRHDWTNFPRSGVAQTARCDKGNTNCELFAISLFAFGV